MKEKKSKYEYDRSLDNLRIIGNRIAEARIINGLKSVELAKMLNVSKDFMSRVENGRQLGFSDEFLDKVAKTLDVTVEYILDGDKMCLYINKVESLIRSQTDYRMIETAIEVLEAIFKLRPEMESR